ncbi:MAG: hypothetical protein AABX83_03820 [Nanoarchaeota archaeon]
MPIRSRENLIGAWAFLLGVILAILVGVIAGFIGKTNISPLVLGILAILGLVVGYFVAEKNVQTFLIASVSLVLVSFAGIQGLVLSAAVLGIDVGRFITSVLGALMFLFIPATVVVAMKTVFSLATR